MKIANPLYDHAFKYLMSNDRLQEEDLRARLRAEEEVEMLFAQQEADKAQLRSLVEEERQHKEAAKAREEKERKLKEEAQQQARENTLKLARLLLKAGVPAEEVARETGLSEEDLRNLG